jgi:hypothetical protein
MLPARSPSGFRVRANGAVRTQIQNERKYVGFAAADLRDHGEVAASLLFAAYSFTISICLPMTWPVKPLAFSLSQ